MDELHVIKNTPYDQLATESIFKTVDLMSLNTCLAGLEAQAVLEVLVLSLLMKTFLKQSVTQFEDVTGADCGHSQQILQSH